MKAVRLGPAHNSHLEGNEIIDATRYSRDIDHAMRKRVFGHIRTAKAQISLRIRAALIWTFPVR